MGLKRRRVAYLLGMNEHETKCAIARWEIAAFRLKAALVRWALQERKAGFDPSQPRDDIGRWTDGSGSVGHELTDISAARRPRLGSKPDGHHFVHHSLYSKLPLPPETRKVFDEAKTGRLYATPPHGWDREHAIYNKAVEEHFYRFIANNNIQIERMTPDQAQQFVSEIKSSNDTRIRDFNTKIMMREWQYWMRRGPRRID